MNTLNRLSLLYAFYVNILRFNELKWKFSCLKNLSARDSNKHRQRDRRKEFKCQHHRMKLRGEGADGNGVFIQFREKCSSIV